LIGTNIVFGSLGPIGRSLQAHSPRAGIAALADWGAARKFMPMLRFSGPKPTVMPPPWQKIMPSGLTLSEGVEATGGFGGFSLAQTIPMALTYWPQFTRMPVRAMPFGHLRL
jgi:hypothetical protein